MKSYGWMIGGFVILMALDYRTFLGTGHVIAASVIHFFVALAAGIGFLTTRRARINRQRGAGQRQPEPPPATESERKMRTFAWLNFLLYLGFGLLPYWWPGNSH